MNDNDLLKPVEVTSSDKQLMESPEVEKIAKDVIAKNNMDNVFIKISF